MRVREGHASLAQQNVATGCSRNINFETLNGFFLVFCLLLADIDVCVDTQILLQGWIAVW